MTRATLTTMVMLAVTGCYPDLSGRGAPPSNEPTEAARIELWPPPSGGLSAPIVRARIILPDGLSADVEGAAWVEGDVGDAHLRQLAAHDPSNAFSERFLPFLSWVEPDPGGGTAIVLAPTVPLEVGPKYTVAHGEPPLALDVSAGEPAPWPSLRRVWPPLDTPSAVAIAVWCGSAPLPVAEATGALDPGPIEGTFRTFATSEQQGAHCVRFDTHDALTPPPANGVLPPPVLQLNDVTFQLDPGLIVGGSVEASSSTPLECDAGEVAFGPGCALVEDDRLRVRGPDRPLMWAVTGEALDEVFATTPLEPFTLRPLPPSSPVTLRIGTLDLTGARASHSFATTMQPAMSHVVLNEVLANAIGPEPEQEWIEIFNDGLAPGSLGELTLIDIGGVTPLPNVQLAPGAFALLVNEGYLADGEYDPAPAPGALVLEVPKLGKNGLANAGEPLKLVDAEDRVMSRFPDEPKPKPGVSVARTHPDAPDGHEGSFVHADPPTPGAPN